jgi:hypothetical protein
MNCLTFVLTIRLHALLVLCILSSNDILASFTPFLAVVMSPFLYIASAGLTGPLSFT